MGPAWRQGGGMEEASLLPARCAPWANLVLPGAGLILVGAVSSGVLVGLLFAVCANMAVAATLLFPDDFPWSTRMLIIGFAGGSYLGAQLRFAQTVRSAREAEHAAWRRAVLTEVQALLQRGAAGEALEVLSPLSRRDPEDVLVAYRLAQVLTATGNKHAARAAWRQLRRLDQHGLYRQQLLENEPRLGGSSFP